ncbi:MAG: 1-aminocyclopropane-1-carboxylate deaminase/D-cysteine desulfhydrase, partial [Gammaproteobacteria bacterium]
MNVMNSPLHDVSHCFPLAPSTSLTILLKRDDLIHPIVSGNKWRKLYGLTHQLPEGAKVFTMGGPWSNHAHAVAYVANLYRWNL